MNILHLTGMNSTKYGGLEHYLVELQKLNGGGYQYVFITHTLPILNMSKI